ncbi:MAG: tetratricopeptide repeat protein, partial [Myxococcales bacterium]|nr:tetratricopeptide repeat protein [Myxococcales bacterium]
MARASAHLAAGRFSQAIGAYRAALGIDPRALHAHLGLADAMTARGR